MRLEELKDYFMLVMQSVINWVKQAACEIRKMRAFNDKKTNILELDEMCINFKKKYGFEHQ